MMLHVIRAQVTSSDCEGSGATVILDENFPAAKTRSRNREGCLADITVLNRTFRICGRFVACHIVSCTTSTKAAKMRLSWAFGLLAGSWTTILAAENHQTTTSDATISAAEPTYTPDDLLVAQNPMQMGAMPASNADGSPRHRQEKAHLMKRMSRKHGSWGTSHPRYRLFEALWGFSRCRDRNVAELEKWRRLYQNVGKKQKKVRGTLRCFVPC